MSGPRTVLCTMIRLAAVQRWPLVPNALHTMPIDREREVGVVEHDDRVLAAHFQRAAFAGFGGCDGYAMSDLVESR